MSRDKVNVVSRLFQAVESRDLPALLALYDPGIVIQEAESLPYGGEYRGIEGATQHAMRYVETWHQHQTATDALLQASLVDSRKQVVVLWRQKAHSTSGTALDLPAVSIYTVRDGRVTESRMFLSDTFAALRFLKET